jgi:hypothetical protein
MLRHGEIFVMGGGGGGGVEVGWGGGMARHEGSVAKSPV